MTYEDFFGLLQARRSIRSFTDQSLEKQTLEKILASAILAPSIENTQPWHFHVLENAELKKKMMGCSCYGHFTAGGATFIVVSCDKSAKGTMKGTMWNPKEMEYSCAIVMHDIMLAATTLGIGSCWISLHHGPAHDLLKLPDHNVIIGGVMLGYTSDVGKQQSAERKRRALPESVTYYA